LFVSFDGIDGTGKSTQCRLLVDHLRAQGRPVVHCVEPGTTAVGQSIRHLLLHQRHDMAARTEALLFLAARAELVETLVRPALERGDVVVSDRFMLSTLVYQGHAGGLDVDELRQVGAFATRGIAPDLTFVLDLPVAAARARLTATPDRMESRPAAYFERVRAGFLAEAGRDAKCRIIDASRTVEVIHREIVGAVDELERRSRA